MTIGELIDLYRPRLDDQTVGIRKSWEETFRYTTRHFSPNTAIVDFDLEILADRLAQSGMQQKFVDGYISRWHSVLDWQRSL
jgi:hypothetical protein